MKEKEKAAVLVSSVPTGEKQPLKKEFNKIITDSSKQCNLQATNNYDLKTISMTDLYDTAYPPKLPIIDGLLYNGTYLFVGSPKIGKSFFMAQLGYHVSMGLPLWGYQVRQGTVLYLALEDDYARIQSRLSKMFDVESSDNLYFATKSKTLNAGLEQQLNNFVAEHKDVNLIIIDTLQRIKEIGGEKFSYANDYEIVTKLKAFSDTYNICLLLVHHTRKMDSNDSFDMISGTNGLLGAADGAFVLQKEKRTDNKAKLEISGRDQQDLKMSLNFNRKKCVWELNAIETEVWKEPDDPLLEAIANIIKNQAEWKGTASELVKILDLDIQPNVLTRKLNINTVRLYDRYKIRYENRRGHSGRTIKFTIIKNN